MTIEAMKRALEALEALQGGCTDSDDGTVEAITVWCPELITTLRAAIEQAEKQEPVAWMFVNTDGECEQIEYIKNEPMPDDPSVTPLYTAPRQWQGEVNTRQLLAESYGDELLLLDPPEVFDRCVIGVAERIGMEPVVVYSEDAVIDALMRGGMDRKEAAEYFSFNIAGAYVGDRTPMFLRFVQAGETNE